MHKIMDIEDYSVEKIENYSFLTQVINFLKNGFNQSDLFAYKYLDYLLTMNTISESEPFGYALFKKDKLEGAILTAFQGYYIKNKGKDEKKVKVINNCNWFVNKQSRVIPALFHIKKVIDLNKDSIITSYTPNKTGFNVNTRLGFKKMKAFLYRKFKPNLKKFIFLQTNNIKGVINPQYDDKVFSKNKLGYRREIMNFSIELKNSGLIFFSGVFKKMKIKSVYVESFFILWTSDYFDIYNNFDAIHKFLFLNYGCISLYYYCPNYLKDKLYIPQNYCKDLKFMIRSNLDIDYLSPIDSELSLGGF